MILDKPIILVVPHGAHVPENIKRVARALEYFDYGDAFTGLIKTEDGWNVGNPIYEDVLPNSTPVATGTTPSETVAKLWLMLQR